VRHPAREAVARCPVCSGFFCRECVSDHSGRLVCAACLARELATATPARKTRFKGVGRAMGCAAGVLVTWILFYALGSLLLRIPTSFHEGTVWKGGLDQERTE
jgi:hypothetical protein